MWPAGSATNALPECQQPMKPSSRPWKSGWPQAAAHSDYLQRHWRSRNPQWKRSGTADISTDYAALFSGIKNPYGAPSKRSLILYAPFVHGKNRGSLNEFLPSSISSYQTPPSLRDVWNRRRLWRIQTMKKRRRFARWSRDERSWQISEIGL